MNQAISIDLIYAILYSITEHTVGVPKANVSEGKVDPDYLKMYHLYDFDNKNTTNIDFIVKKKYEQDDQEEFEAE